MITTTVNISEEHQEYIIDCARYPAVSNQPDVYFLREGKIIANGRIGVYYNGEVVVYLIDAEGLELFKYDYAVKHLGKYAAFRFDELSGEATRQYDDEPGNRMEGISIVSKFDFDFGIASPTRYGSIPGFGIRRNA